jgi:hypothetical protein
MLGMKNLRDLKLREDVRNSNSQVSNSHSRNPHTNNPKHSGEDELEKKSSRESAREERSSRRASGQGMLGKQKH